MKLKVYKYWDENTLDYKRYQEEQIKRHFQKRDNKKDKEHYQLCAKETIDLIPCNAEMICMGTRNNFERDEWQEGLQNKNTKVYSLDIAGRAEPDFKCDFNYLPTNWNEKWDIIFSNSIDHSIDAEKTFYKWFSVLKSGGIMIIGFDEHLGLAPADCCAFEKNNVREFVTEENKLFEYIKTIELSYDYHVLRKKQ